MKGTRIQVKNIIFLLGGIFLSSQRKDPLPPTRKIDERFHSKNTLFDRVYLSYPELPAFAVDEAILFFNSLALFPLEMIAIARRAAAQAELGEEEEIILDQAQTIEQTRILEKEVQELKKEIEAILSQELFRDL